MRAPIGRMSSTTLTGIAVCVVLAGCGNDQRSPNELSDPNAFGVSGLRRLTRVEVANSVGDVFGVDAVPLQAMLPEDISGGNPFDNNYRAQTVSPLVISDYSAFASAYAAQLAVTLELPQRLGGCTPVAPDDRSCFDAIASNAGRRMFRRPLESAELSAYGDAILPHAKTAGSFATAIEMLGLLLVQHPAFLYRLEQDGDLDNFQIATRMSFLLWGSVPDDELLDAAEDAKLDDASVRAVHAERMLDDPRAKRNLHRFHELWLGFSDAPLPTNLAADLREETSRLVDRVVFEQDAEWLSLFNASETYVTPALATQYGFAPVAGPGWVTYPAGRGGGVLTHGSFLSLGAKFGDTSPTVRGAEIFHRLSCGELGTIPPNVDTDMPPGLPTDCKPERYSMREITGCDQCHGIIDNIGFGLENFGVFGAWRATEPGKPQCVIDAVGSWNGMAFSGPEQLGALIADDPRVSACATKQVFRWMTGRDEDSGDRNTLGVLDAHYRENRSLRALLLQLVTSPAIAYRKGE
ncbi:MAG TPA: DUF1592 domain-containing protein [Kofleriaceae bacterium]